MVKIDVFGKHLGDNAITEAFQTRDFGFLLSLKTGTQKVEWILSFEEAKNLKIGLEKCFNDIEKLKRM